MAKTSPGTDAFNVDKLLEYNELATCFAHIHKEFGQCNNQTVEKTKSFLGQIPLPDALNVRLKCCGTWQLRDCWMKAANQKCTKAQADMIYKLPTLAMPELAKECQDYTPESGKCNFTWIIVLMVFVIILMVASCCGCLYYCIKRRNKRQCRHRRMRPPEQRPYSMTHSQNSIYKAASYQNGGTKMNGVLVPPTPHNCNYNHDHDHHDHSYSQNNIYKDKARYKTSTNGDEAQMPFLVKP